VGVVSPKMSNLIAADFSWKEKQKPPGGSMGSTTWGADRGEKFRRAWRTIVERMAMAAPLPGCTRQVAPEGGLRGAILFGNAVCQPAGPGKSFNLEPVACQQW